MGMQIPSLSMGDPVSFHKGLPKENRLQVPGEQRFTPEYIEAQSRASRPEIRSLEQTASSLERISLAFNRRLKFEINSDSREIVVKVIDNETDKVIRELPPEELQRLHSRIQESVGVLFDRMV